MINLKIRKMLNKYFTPRMHKQNSVLSTFLISLFSFVIIIAIVLAVMWNFKNEIFDYLIQSYLTEQQSINSNVSDQRNTVKERIIEKKSILNQETLVVSTVKKTNPAVVSIIISKEVPKYEAYIDPNQRNNPFGDLFPGFNFSFPKYRQNGTEKKEIGGGSGFLVTKNGLIVTNKHVVDQKDVEYTVFTNDGKKHSASVVARDPVLDIALIKIHGSDFPALSLGDSDKLQVGQTVIAIGNALAEFRNTVSVGVVSGLSRSITAGDSFGKTELLSEVIQTDAAINPGNSGGPLLNLNGRVIGVNVAVAQGSQNIGFALPINSVKGAIQSVKATGKILHPFLGVRYVMINKIMQERNNLSVDYGVLIKSGANPEDLAVIPGSPADKAGIVENDILLEIDGVKLGEKSNLASIIRKKKIGETIKIKMLHRGAEKYVFVTLEAAKD